MIRLTLTVFLL